MNGWKTWAGVAGLVAGGACSAFGMTDVANVIYSFAVPMVIVGIGHKLDKAARMSAAALNAIADQLEKGQQMPTPPAQKSS